MVLLGDRGAGGRLADSAVTNQARSSVAPDLTPVIKARA